MGMDIGGKHASDLVAFHERSIVAPERDGIYLCHGILFDLEVGIAKLMAAKTDACKAENGITNCFDLNIAQACNRSHIVVSPGKTLHIEWTTPSSVRSDEHRYIRPPHSAYIVPPSRAKQ
jgi:hypothetical protein